MKIEATCLLYDILYHVLIFIMYEEFILKKFVQGVCGILNYSERLLNCF